MLNIKWDLVLSEEFDKPYFTSLLEKLELEYKNYTVYPEYSDIFTAFKLVDYNDVKVVILGQDPYHNPNQAHGLAFSVKEGCPLPPSLKNIYKEIEDDLGLSMGKSGHLVKWANQGVFMLNAILTVRKNEPKSHDKIGWKTFTDEVIKKLNEKTEPLVFLLWGNDAISKSKFITNPNHLILTSVHPSPLSSFRGFFGCKHFSLANKFVSKHYNKTIDWQI